MYRPTAYVRRILSGPTSVLGEGFWKCASNRNIINLGTAENHLIEEEILRIFQSRPDEDATHLTYSSATATLPLPSPSSIEITMGFRMSTPRNCFLVQASPFWSSECASLYARQMTLF
jgi:hypothetical protein